MSEAAFEEVRRQIINSPETADFMAGVPLEAAHQRERWGADHDAGKTPWDWFWLVGYLSQKAGPTWRCAPTSMARFAPTPPFPSNFQKTGSP